MKLIKLFAAGLLLSASLQANGFSHHSDSMHGYVAGLLSGIVIFNAMTPRYEQRPTYVVYKEHSYHRPHFSHRHHAKKRHSHFKHERRH